METKLYLTSSIIGHISLRSGNIKISALLFIFSVVESKCQVCQVCQVSTTYRTSNAKRKTMILSQTLSHKIFNSKKLLLTMSHLIVLHVERFSFQVFASFHSITVTTSDPPINVMFMNVENCANRNKCLRKWGNILILTE